MYIRTIIFLLLSQTFLFAQTVGLASWYGEKFEGRTTASGELFNRYDYTAAHKTLPFGTIVTVTNIQNGKSINVRVNDRGPYKTNRIMDISFQAAKAIGLVKMGTTTVSIVPQNISTAKMPVVRHTELSMQTLSKEALASMMEYALRVTEPKKNMTQPVVKNSQIFKVQIASSSTKAKAEKFMAKERTNGYKMAIVSAYSTKLKQTRHKVVILTNSKARAMAIINTKYYKGAYLLR